jgi:glycosyltransferase involved in cell wall biosynthesis
VLYPTSAMDHTGVRLSKLLKIRHILHIREFGFLDYHYYHVGGDVLKRYFLNKSDQLIAISKSIENYIALPHKVKLVYNGIFSLTEIYNNEKSKVLDGRVNIGMVGVISLAKNQKDAIEAIKKLVDKNYDVILNIYGDILDYIYYEEIKKYIKDYEIDKKIIFNGFISDKNRIYSEIDILLMCSPNEAFGRVTIEAMAAGIPVIGYNNAGTAELVIDEFNGFLYDYENKPLDLLIQKLVDNKKLYEKFSKNATLTASEYSVEDYGENILKIIQRIDS